jgi:hypothetical protein
MKKVIAVCWLCACDSTGRDRVGVVLRSGARRLLAQAIEAEAAAFWR